MKTFVYTFILCASLTASAKSEFDRLMEGVFNLASLGAYLPGLQGEINNIKAEGEQLQAKMLAEVKQQSEKQYQIDLKERKKFLTDRLALENKIMGTLETTEQSFDSVEAQFRQLILDLRKADYSLTKFQTSVENGRAVSENRFELLTGDPDLEAKYTISCGPLGQGDRTACLWLDIKKKIAQAQEPLIDGTTISTVKLETGYADLISDYRSLFVQKAQMKEAIVIDQSELEGVNEKLKVYEDKS